MTILMNYFPLLDIRHTESYLYEFFRMIRKYADTNHPKNNYWTDDNFTFLGNYLPGDEEVFCKITSNQGDLGYNYIFADNYDENTYLVYHQSHLTTIDLLMPSKIPNLSYPLYIAFFTRFSSISKISNAEPAFINVYALDYSTAKYEFKKKILPIAHYASGHKTNISEQKITYLLFKIEQSDVNYGEYTVLNLSSNLKNSIFDAVQWITNNEYINKHLAAIAYTRKNNNFNLNLIKINQPFKIQMNFPFGLSEGFSYDYFANGNLNIHEQFWLNNSGTVARSSVHSAPLIQFANISTSSVGGVLGSIGNSFSRFERGVKKVEALEYGSENETKEGLIEEITEFTTDCGNGPVVYRRITLRRNGKTRMWITYLDSNDDFSQKQRIIDPTSKTLIQNENGTYFYKLVFDVNESNDVLNIGFLRQYTNVTRIEEQFNVCSYQSSYKVYNFDDYTEGVKIRDPVYIENEILYASQEHIFGTENAQQARVNYLHTQKNYLAIPRYYPYTNQTQNLNIIDVLDDNLQLAYQTITTPKFFIKKVDENYIYGPNTTNNNSIQLRLFFLIPDKINEIPTHITMDFFCDSYNFYARLNSISFPNGKIHKYTFLQFLQMLKNKTYFSYNFATIFYKNAPLFIRVADCSNVSEQSLYIPGMYFEWNDFFDLLEKNNIDPNNTKQSLEFVCSLTRPQKNTSEFKLDETRTFICFSRYNTTGANSIIYSGFYPHHYRRNYTKNTYIVPYNNVKYRTYNYKPLT